MNGTTISIIVGVFFALNLISILLIWFRLNTPFMDKLNEVVLNIILFILSLCGGFIGVYLGREMFGYKTATGRLEKWMTKALILEVTIIVIVLTQVLGN
jgi:uncharacterized membrane protein YsdA (DUF1294 family)